MKSRQIIKILVPMLGTLLLLSLGNIAYADTGSATFAYFLGVPPLCALGATACPDIAGTSTGCTISITGSGTLSIHPESVTGGGTFTETGPSGCPTASGSWTATDLLSFDSFGSSPPPLPFPLTGGQALIRVHLDSGADGVLKVTCLLGSPPAGKMEGVELNIQAGPNFNHEVSGFTVFLAL